MSRRSAMWRNEALVRVRHRWRIHTSVMEIPSLTTSNMYSGQICAYRLNEESVCETHHKRDRFSILVSSRRRERDFCFDNLIFSSLGSERGARIRPKHQHLKSLSLRVTTLYILKESRSFFGGSVVPWKNVQRQYLSIPQRALYCGKGF